VSHVVGVELEISDLDAFAAAVEALGGEYLAGETRWRWYGCWVRDYHKGDAAYKHGVEPSRYGVADAGVARFSGCDYDLGLYKHPTKEGVFLPVFDFFSGGKGLVKKLGRNLEHLKTEYGLQVSESTMRSQGYWVQRTTHPQTGRARLVCRK